MRRAIQIFVGISITAGCALILLVFPFLSRPNKDYAIIVGLGLVAVAVVIGCLHNRLTIGTWTRLVTPQERKEVRQRAVADQIGMILWLIPMLIVGLPVAFKLKSLGWSKEATVIVSLLVAAPISAAILFVLRRWAKSAAARKAGGPLSPT